MKNVEKTTRAFRYAVNQIPYDYTVEVTNLFKKIRDTKGILHTKIATIKDRNGMDLPEAEILRRGGKDTQKKYTKKI